LSQSSFADFSARAFQAIIKKFGSSLSRAEPGLTPSLVESTLTDFKEETLAAPSRFQMGNTRPGEESVSSIVMLAVGIIIVILMLCCCCAIWWDLLDCSSYVTELRQERRIRRILEKVADNPEVLPVTVVVSPVEFADDAGDQNSDLQMIKITLTNDKEDLSETSHSITYNVRGKVAK
jgi:hypothetical protein